MAKKLGTPYLAGKSDVIRNYAPEGAVAEGLIYTLSSSGKMKVKTASTDIAKGVSGMLEVSRQSGVEAGLEVYVRTSDTAVTVGAPVYVTNTGMVTKTATGNTAVNAVFATDVTECITSDGTIVAGAGIDFVGGL